MEKVKRTVDELNELAKKITGVNPKAKTDAQAINYIEQNLGDYRASIYVYDLYENEQGINEIDLTSKQLKDMYEATKGHILIFINDGYGLLSFIDNFDLGESSTISSSTYGTNLFSNADDEKFNEGE